VVFWVVKRRSLAGINVSQERIASIFRIDVNPEDGGDIFIRNVGDQLAWRHNQQDHNLHVDL
jgi:hypothetical protein